MRRKWGKGLSILLSGAMLAGSLAVQPLNVAAAPTGTEITEAEMQELIAKSESSDAIVNRSRVSVHDPSVTKAGDTYYIYGSHMGVAKSTDLLNWTSLGTENSVNSSMFGNAEGEVVPYTEAFEENAYQGKITTVINGQEVELDFGTYNIEEWIYRKNADGSEHTVNGNMWAPDVIYNPTMEQWCLYYSLNGPDWNSAVVLMTSDNVEGPYCYQGPIVFTGFGTSTVSKSFKNTDIELVLGEMDELPTEYQKLADRSWGTWFPHAIDPSVFYDDEGKLWLAYGSWSGGIAMLELDEETGLRDYTVTYESNMDTLGQSWTSDAYFGKRIAGGYYVSGEGPYIEKIGDYYYLFMSYGGFAPDGGYEMRIFRSENPDGPYVDADGTSAIFEKAIYPNYSNKNETRGEKLMGNYKWTNMTKAEVAQGHNSAIVDEDGKAYVVYHTKFNDGTVGHEVRVHQLFVNEDGWLVAAPYEYSGETLSETAYASEKIVGTYDVIVHEYVQDYANLAYEAPQQIELKADGTITGAYTGTWTGSTTEPEITLVIDGHTYKGVLLEQKVDNTAYTAMCFTVCGDQGLCIWGSMQQEAKDIIAYNASNLTIAERAWKDITLPTTGDSGVEISWASSNAAVLTAAGVVGNVTEDTKVTLTATIAKDDYYYNKTFDVMVMAGDGTYAEKTLIASYFVDEPQSLVGKNDGSLSVANPFYDGTSKGLDISSGASIEFDVTTSEDVNVLATLIGFTGNGGKLYFTEGSYLGYNGTGGWYDANLDKQETGYFLAKDYIGETAHVAINFTRTGFEVYVNEELAYDQTNLETETGDSSNGTEGEAFEEHRNVLTWLSKYADTLNFGSGAWWTDQSATASISNVECYAAAYVAEDEKDLIIQYEKDEAVIDADSTCIVEENPFYGAKADALYMEYTINFAEGAAKNGWDGIFSFYNSSTGGRISMQVNPYLCFNNASGTWVDINWTGNTESAAWVKTAENGKDYKITFLVTEDDITITVDGTELVHTIDGEATNRQLLDFLVTCDQLTWGVGAAKTAYWDSELCTIKDVYFANYENIATIEKDKVELTSTDFIEIIDNPVAGKEVLAAEMNYTLNIASGAAKNGWDGIFSFYNSETGGRISMQTNPYLCYNVDEDNVVKWLDVNGPNDGGTNWASTTAIKGQDYEIYVKITEEDVVITIDGEKLNLSKNGINGSVEDMLKYIGQCDQFSWGVGLAQTAYWWTELATISNAEIKLAYKDMVAEEGITFDVTELNIATGSNKSITATVTPEDATYKNPIWSSSDETVATVSNGVVTGVKEGTATITATTQNGLTATCTVTVKDQLAESVTLDQTKLTLAVGEKSTVIATVSPEDTTNKTLKWTSSNADIAAVSSKGEITAKAAGIAVITVTTSNGLTATCDVIVKAVEAEAVALDKTEATLKAGEELTLTATITPENTTDNTLTWSTDNADVATVADGVVTAVAAGTATITVTTANGKTATCTITVEAVAVEKLVITDIDENHWGYTFVTAIAEQKIMNGVHTNEDGSIEFAPNDKLTREMVAQILYNAEGTPEITTENDFTDVVAGAWYEKAVTWAAETGIVSGYLDGTFGVGKNITRQEIATMLNNYAKYKEYDTTASGDISTFEDTELVAEWATDNMKWAVGNDIITGKSGNLLDPKGDATRAEAATMIYKFKNAFENAE